MPFRIGTWLRLGARSRIEAQSRSGPTPNGGAPKDDRLPRARLLAIAIEDAIRLGEPSRARRLAELGASLVPHSVRLREAVARVRAAAGQWGEAAALLRSGQVQTQSATLLLAVCLLRQGRRPEAHGILRQLVRNEATAPSEARSLLAHLEHDLGDDHVALETLLRDLRHAEHPLTLEQIVLMSAVTGRDDSIRRYAARLELASGLRMAARRTARVLASLSVDPAMSHVPATGDVQQLAMELAVNEEAIPALVTAQEIRPARQAVALLRRAIEQALGDLNEPAAAMEGIARLYRIESHTAAALSWVDAALAVDPHRHVLHQLRQELTAGEGGAMDARTSGDQRDVIGTISVERDKQRGKAA